MASLFPCVFINWDEENAKKELGQYPAISTTRLLPSENKYPSSLRSFPMYDEIALNCLRRIAYFLRHSFAKKKTTTTTTQKKIMKKSLYMTRICYFHVSVHTHTQSLQHCYLLTTCRTFDHDMRPVMAWLLSKLFLECC